jgi:hypothetical protein
MAEGFDEMMLYEWLKGSSLRGHPVSHHRGTGHFGTPDATAGSRTRGPPFPAGKALWLEEHLPA